RGVVITHGTDTMHYTSAALSFMLKDIKGPVVLTGAQRSGDRGSSDAFMNLICSTQLAANSDIEEVGICMHTSSSDERCGFIRGTHARKMHTSRRDAFRPVNNRFIAKVGYEGKIDYISDYRRMGSDDRKTKALANFEPRVALVKTYPDADPEIMDYYLGKKYKGVIIEGTGLGHAPVSTSHREYNWLSAITNAVESGMIVGMASQCLYGRVNDRVYRNERLVKKAGAISCEDMIPEVAYVKLGWLLGNYKKDEAARLLGRNMVGEIGGRSEVDWFGE
ncbi:MAG TPA: Glu-tRNA(Gln) amidotransferase subunit GatD, partial [Candidatus Saccharimonadales bacterium]|nr:Glu-tRNA(Gln) amidotransferase subunit GatD [Candidatus Saccharimonadales bacterium]